MKVCIDCKREQPLSAFHRNAARKDGRVSYCKLCACIRTKRWVCANPERHKASVARYRKNHVKEVAAAAARWHAEHPGYSKEYGTRYRKEHAEQVAATTARWHAAHPEERKVTWKRYRETHAEARRASIKRWHKAHPEWGREQNRRRRARVQAVRENFTVEMERFVRGYWKRRCAVCGATEKLCIDHWLPLVLGNALTMENAVLLCSSCNSSKNAKLPEAIYESEFVKTIRQHLQEQAQRWSATTGAA